MVSRRCWEGQENNNVEVRSKAGEIYRVRSF